MDLSYEALAGDYNSLWRIMKMTPLTHERAYRQLTELRNHRVRYAEVEAITKVPWYWVGITHLREAGEPPNFHAWLHNGDPMFNHLGKPCCTVHEPRGRPLNPDVSWEQGAVDALAEMGFAHKDWDYTPARLAWMWEKFNGFGYREYHKIPSPYLWGGTSVQEPGKYVRDREFDPSKFDEQLGAMAVYQLVVNEKEMI